MNIDIFPYESTQPLDEKLIIFMSYPDFSVGSLVFWEYIIKNTDYKTVWFVEDTEIQKKMQQDGIACCNFISEEKNNYLSNAKYVILDKICPAPMPKPKGQLWILLYSAVHFVYDVFCHKELSKNFSFLESVKIRSNNIDLAAVNSKLAIVYTSAIQYMDSRKIFNTGSPKFDPIFNDDGKAILFNYMPQLKKYNKLILYCPTGCCGHFFKFGNDFSDNLFKIKDFNAFEFEKFLDKHNAAIVFKMHPVDERYFKEIEISLPNNCYMIYSISFYRKSIYNILNAFDVLITDFSQLSNEYLILDRPIIYNYSDYESIRGIRSTYIEDNDFSNPGMKIKNYLELINAIECAFFNPDNYHTERNKLKELLHEYNDGNSSERVLELMQNFTPVENIDYELFAKPYKIQYGQTKQELDNILSSKSYKITKKLLNIIKKFIRIK